jgi:hypothetical protein
VADVFFSGVRGPGSSVGEPLDALHDEFLRVARDPSQLAGHGDWGGFTATAAEGAPTLADLSEQASAYPTLRDIVLRREGIDEIIGAFDPGSHVEPLAAVPETPEVLRLFLPDAARETPAFAPGLTRREHHALSPDSPMPPSVARTTAAPKAPTATQGGATHAMDQ